MTNKKSILEWYITIQFLLVVPVLTYRRGMVSLRCLLQHPVLFFLSVLQHSPTRCLEIRESFLLLEIITLQLPPSWEPHTPGPYSSIAFGFPSVYDVGLSSCPSRICVEYSFPPFDFPDATQSAHLHMHFLHIP